MRLRDLTSAATAAVLFGGLCAAQGAGAQPASAPVASARPSAGVSPAQEAARDFVKTVTKLKKGRSRTAKAAPQQTQQAGAGGPAASGPTTENLAQAEAVAPAAKTPAASALESVPSRAAASAELNRADAGETAAEATGGRGASVAGSVAEAPPPSDLTADTRIDAPLPGALGVSSAP